MSPFIVLTYFSTADFDNWNDEMALRWIIFLTLIFSPICLGEGESVLKIGNDPGFHAQLLKYFEFYRSDKRVGESEYPIYDARNNSSFTRMENRSTLAVNNETEWVRAKIQNIELHSIDLYLFNSYLIGDLDIILVSAGGVQKYQLGFNHPIFVGEGTLFPAFKITIPSGNSIMYLGYNTNKLPFFLSFQLASDQVFQAKKINRLIILSSISAVVVSFIIFYLLLFIVTRNPLYGIYLIPMIASVCYVFLITGIVALAGPYVTKMLIPHWFIVALWPSGGLAFFLMEFFEIKREKDRILYYFLLSSAVLSFITPFFYQFYWKNFLTIISLLLAFSFTASFFTVLSGLKTHPKRSISFVIAFWPLFFATIIYSVGLYLHNDAEIYLQYYLFCGVINIIAIALLIGVHNQETQKLRDAFEIGLKAVLSPKQIEKIVQRNVHLDTEPVNKRVTIMFIDIVGYSQSLNRLAHKEAFIALKNKLSQLTTIIHKYDGVIDKSLGDGCLCFFGYDLLDDAYEGHEKTALECAIEIQRAAVDSSIENPLHVYPIRIGINTAEVYIGNMGDDTRFDITMSGQGVVLASRFETACEPFKIIIGKETLAGLEENYLKKITYYRRLVSIKHQSALEECYEINPLGNFQEKIDLVNRVFWESIGTRKVNERFKVSPGTMFFESEFGPMEVVDYSYDGFRIRAQEFLGKQTSFLVVLAGLKDHPMIGELYEITVKVMWGMPCDEPGYYKLGIKINGLSKRQKEIILNILHDHQKNICESVA